MEVYLLVFFGSVLVALVVTPMVIRFAIKHKLVDEPDARKIHSEPIPRVGGIALFATTFFVVGVAIGVVFLVEGRLYGFNHTLAALLGASGLVFLTGVVDDIRGLSGEMKFIVLGLASLMICASGARIDSLSVGSLLTLNLGLASWPLTIIWISGITVGINFIDGADGLAAGLSGIACLTIAVIAFCFGQPMVGVMMLAMLGALCGFLLFNFNPAVLFMGDCGSMFLGFTIGAATVVVASESSSIVGLALPSIALGIPIIDAACTMIRRGILERRSIFKAERGHVHHRLLDLGLSQRQVVIILYLVSAVATALGSFMLITSEAAAIVVFICVFVLLFLMFHLVGSVRVKETVAAIREHRAMKKKVGRFKNSFEDIQLQVRVADSFEAWWKALCNAAEHMNFVWLSLDMTEPDGDTKKLNWKPETTPCVSEAVITTLPVVYKRPGISMQFELAIPVDDSLEVTNHRTVVFSRLLDETNLQDILGTKCARPIADKKVLAREDSVRAGKDND